MKQKDGRMVVNEVSIIQIKKRQGLVIWVYSLKQVKQLRRFGLIYYASRRMKYVYLYVDQDKVVDTEIRVKKLRFVRRVELSHRPELDMNFAAKVGAFDADPVNMNPAAENEPELEDSK